MVDGYEPHNRRSHEATHFGTNVFDADTETWNYREWMVITGGFTDSDFCSFPVFAVEVSSINEDDELMGGNGGWVLIDRGWRDEEVTAAKTENYCGNIILDEETGGMLGPLRPPARIGHVTGISEDGVLYVIGGENTDGRIDVDTIFQHPDPGKYLSVWSVPILEALIGNSTAPASNQTYFEGYMENSTSPTLEWTYSIYNETNENPSPINRGSMASGVWKERDSIIFHGGLDIGTDTIYGDVWMFNMKNKTFELLANNPLPGEIGYPGNRISHAASIKNDVLYIHGGMGMVSVDNGMIYSSASTWITLSDVWEFDLLKHTWKNRHVTPTLARAYHSMVVSNNNDIVCYGGNRRTRDPMNNIVAYVFDDILVLEHDTSLWYKLEEPSNKYSPNPKFRFDHKSIIDDMGNMFVWGGKFQRVDQLFGLWKFFIPHLDEVRDQLIEARPDETDIFTADMQSLQLFILTIMFGGMLLVAIYTTFRWQSIQRAQGQDGHGNAIFGGGRAGASQEVFDSIPTRSYHVSKQDELTRGVSDTIVEDLNVEDCCAICLDGYIEGDSLKCLPCGHDFHSQCVEEWIRNHNSTCPQCRQDLTSITVAMNSSSRGRIGGLRGFVIRHLMNNQTGSVSTRFNLLTARHSDRDEESPMRLSQQENTNIPTGNVR